MRLPRQFIYLVLNYSALEKIRMHGRPRPHRIDENEITKILLHDNAVIDRACPFESIIEWLRREPISAQLDLPMPALQLLVVLRARNQLGNGTTRRL